VLVLATLAALVAFAGALLTAHLSGDSMEGGLQTGDVLLVDKVTIQFQAPKRGDVVVATEPNGVPIVKRVIGVPGDVLEIDGDHRDPGATGPAPAVLIMPGGHGGWQRLDEPYLTLRWTRPDFCCDDSGENIPGANPRPVTLGPDEFFLMGDNRNVSRDSRSFGLVPRDRILGRVVARYWPLKTATVVSARPTLVPA
jgi:signal peptidase I